MENAKQELAVEKNLSVAVGKRIDELIENKQLVLPKNYIAANALKSAWLMISQDEKAMSCTTVSINQVLMDMVIQGLNPAKKQCYFIPYAKKKCINGQWIVERYDLTLSRSYFGDEAAAKNVGLLTDINAVVIYKGDELEIGFDEIGAKIVKSHTTKFENIDNEIIGAYAIGYYPSGLKIYEIMTKKEIEKSWAMSSNSKADNGKKNQLQSDFTQEACKRTVIRRLVKRVFNTSSDESLVIESFNKTTDNDYIDIEPKEVNTNKEMNEVHKEQVEQTASIQPNINESTGEVKEPQPVKVKKPQVDDGWCD